MQRNARIPIWTIATPVFAGAVLLAAGLGFGRILIPFIAAGVAAGLARDTVFAAVMIILNGIIGLCLLVGGLMHREQSFSLDGVSAALVALGAIVILTLVFPNYTITTPGPYYSPSQLGLIGIVTVVIYGAFVFTQTVGHRRD